MQSIDNEAAATSLVDSIGKFSGDVVEMEPGDLTGSAKSSVGVMIGNFLDTIAKLVSGTETEKINSLREPAVESLSTKQKAFTS